MSRIGINPVKVPSGAEVNIEGRQVRAKGPKGELAFAMTDDVDAVLEDGRVVVKPLNDSKRARQMWATTRTLINNLVVGVTEGYSMTLQVNGVGYRAQMQGQDLVLNLGLSHEVRYPTPEGIQIEVDKQNSITIRGIDKQRVGQVAAEIIHKRPPEPYKGKGIKLEGTQLLLKEGKKK